MHFSLSHTKIHCVSAEGAWLVNMRRAHRFCYYIQNWYNGMNTNWIKVGVCCWSESFSMYVCQRALVRWQFFILTNKLKVAKFLAHFSDCTFLCPVVHLPQLDDVHRQWGCLLWVHHSHLYSWCHRGTATFLFHTLSYTSLIFYLCRPLSVQHPFWVLRRSF